VVSQSNGFYRSQGHLVLGKRSLLLLSLAAGGLGEWGLEELSRLRGAYILGSISASNQGIVPSVYVFGVLETLLTKEGLRRPISCIVVLACSLGRHADFTKGHLVFSISYTKEFGQRETSGGCTTRNRSRAVFRSGTSIPAGGRALGSYLFRLYMGIQGLGRSEIRVP